MYSDYSFKVMHTVDKNIDNSKIICEIETGNSDIDDTIQINTVTNVYENQDILYYKVLGKCTGMCRIV